MQVQTNPPATVAKKSIQSGRLFGLESHKSTSSFVDAVAMQIINPNQIDIGAIIAVINKP
jgi:hypothetical protein